MYSLYVLLKMALLFPLLYAVSLAQAVVVIAGKTTSDELENELITCWTCPNKTDNQKCNDWAPNVPCFTNHTICQTVHRMNIKSRKSLRVNKRCAKPEECTQDMIGCKAVSATEVECISCCNFAYCNEPVPTNHSTAILYSSIQTTSGSMSHTSHKWNILPFTICMMGHIFTNHRTLSMPGFMLLLPWLLFTCGVLQSHWVFPLGLSVLGHYSKTSLS